MSKPRRSDEEVMAVLGSRTNLDKARARFSHWVATFEQAEAHPRPPGPIEYRRMELEAVEDIVNTWLGEVGG